MDLLFRAQARKQLDEVPMSTHSKMKKAKLEQPANHYKSPDEITNDADLSEEKTAGAQYLGARRTADDDCQ